MGEAHSSLPHGLQVTRPVWILDASAPLDSTRSVLGIIDRWARATIRGYVGLLVANLGS